ncbi:ABC transporter permease [Nocardioides sp. 1609]|uniref:ABC transporter permease n=1 Tax=Nocardioides sp. 1609 TaxID=2508327 RepID=UPI00106F468D|nr:ABC transporter permease [Nocardioides sp. 1609]
MSIDAANDRLDGARLATPTDPPSVSRARVLLRTLSFRNISAIYILIALVAIYSLWVPDTFLTASVWRSMLDNSALVAIVAVGLVLPLAAGAFDLAVGAEVGLGAIVVAWLLTEQGLGPAQAVVLTLVAGAAVGAFTGILITVANIDSFIASLGMSSVVLAAIAWLSDSQQILNLGEGFQDFATGQLFGFTHPVWLALVVGLIVWYVLERTPVGRRIYATGGNLNAARLAGVRTSLILVGALAACGAIAGFAGALASSRLATGDPTIGPAYLLPAYAAAFLGSTQFRSGRYNVAGTLVAVFVLAVGVKGLQLGGAPVWIPDLFNGMALLLAVGMARTQRRARQARAARGVRRHEVKDE